MSLRMRFQVHVFLSAEFVHQELEGGQFRKFRIVILRLEGALLQFPLDILHRLCARGRV